LLIEVTPQAFMEIGSANSINFEALRSEYDEYSRGVIVCCPYSPELEQLIQQNEPDDAAVHGEPPIIDFVSRFFGPKAGIDEDPVTGSAHCALAPYFCQKLQKDEVIGEQRSSRGGIVHCTMIHGNEMEDRVRITGSANVAVSGSLWI
jgi:predicted PhzF superfamily epimerase YddE/YHI9